MINLCKYKNFIFDFDGVICDSNHIKGRTFVDIFDLLDQNLKKKIYEYHLSNLGMHRKEKILKISDIFLQKKLKKNEIDILINKFSLLIFNKISKIKLNAGFYSLINQLKNKNKNIFLSTATPKYEIEKILKQKKIYEYFDNIYGSPQSKSNHFKKIMNIINYNKNTIFIGDTINDYKISKKFSVDFILYLNSQNDNLRRKINFKIKKFSILTI